MSIIAVRGIPQRWTLAHVLKLFAKVIGGQFETLNFVSGPGKACKTCYLRLSVKLDPLQVVDKVNSNTKLKKLNINAIIPKTVPDIPLAVKPRQIPQKMARSLRIAAKENEYPDKVLSVAHMELLTEMQSKYTKLFNLSKSTQGHQLLDQIARTLFERLYKIMEVNEEARGSIHKLTSSYRRQHPHNGDFSLIVGTLHAIQDGQGAPRSEMTEDQLTGPPAGPYSINNIPYEEIQTATSKYSLKITKKVLEHIRQLRPAPGAGPEAAARARVRGELQNVAMHLPSIIRQVIQKHLSPEKTPFHRIRIYGEPYLPNKDALEPLLRRFRVVKVTRSDRMYNMIKLNVPPDRFAGLAALDGTLTAGAKLVIRSSDIPLYDLPKGLLQEMRAAVRGPAGPAGGEEGVQVDELVQ